MPWKDLVLRDGASLSLNEDAAALTKKPPFTMIGQCHRQPYSQDFDTLHDAVCCAAAAIDLNLWRPLEVSNRNGEVVMGEDELWERAQAI